MLSMVRGGSVTTVISLLIGASIWTLQRTAAEHFLRTSGSLAQTSRACAWMPANSQCWSALARQHEELGLDARTVWSRALSLNPRSAESSIPAALAAERRGDLLQAEGLLLDIARYSQLALPRWTLAGYYLRRNRHAEFWFWARRAFERSYGDRTALFRLCRGAGGDTGKMVRDVLPADAVLRAEYLHFLLLEGSWEELEPAALACLAVPAAQASALPANRVLSEAVDALVQSRHPEAAARLWNRLSSEKRIPYPALDTETLLVNTAFQTPLEFAGFDWRVRPVDGVRARWGSPPGSVKFEFSGWQQNEVGVLEQAIWLPAGRSLAFGCRYRTRAEGEGATGLDWCVLDHLTGEVLFSSPVLASADDWTETGLTLPAQPARRLVLLQFRSRRPSGRARLEAEVWLRDARLEVPR